MGSGILDRINQLLESKADRNELILLTSTLGNKADKGDLEYFASSLSNVKVECEHRLGGLDKKMESFRGELESTRQFINNTINKKVDSKDLERLAQLVNKKIDIDFLEDNMLQLRREVAEQLEDLKGEIVEYKRNVDTNVTERVERSEGFFEKTTEEVYRLSDQLKSVLEMTRNDREQTMNFTKEISGTIKKEMNHVADRFSDDIQTLRKEVGEIHSKKLDKKEWNEAKSKILSQLDGKVDLLEVQDALNTCQADLSSRFIEYKEEIKNLIRNHDGDIYSLLSKKANISDINSILANKADNNTINAMIAQKIDSQEIDDLRRKVEIVMKSNNEKASSRGTKNTHIKLQSFVRDWSSRSSTKENTRRTSEGDCIKGKY